MSTVTSGSVVTLTAAVTADSAPITPGQVNFCDAMAKYCTDIHLLGTAQLTNSGTASIKFRPGIGSHSYNAVFVGTNSSAASTSSSVPLTVTGGLYPTTTTYSTTGGLGTYNITATVAGSAVNAPSPSGSVSFLDTSNTNSVLAQATLNPGAPMLSLVSPPSSVIRKNPSAIAVGDFNGNGIPDLAIASTATSTVRVWLGNGDGTFSAGSTSSTGPNPSAIAVADFNSDGIPDLAITNDNCGLGCTGSVTILLGNGDGTFTPTATSPAAGSGPQAIVAGDFNGDGILDLAVANFEGGSIMVLLGNGDGTFTAAPEITFSNTNPPFIFAADFNGDGKLDLATYDYGTNELIVLLGKGDGTFPNTVTTTTPNLYPESTVMADLNGDGNLDLVMTSAYSEATVFLGTGSGTFTIGTRLGYYSGSLAVGDFNGDGIPDLAANAAYEMHYLLGVGDGTFTKGPTFDASTIANSKEFTFETLVSADFNGDGLSDVAGPGVFIYPPADHALLVPMLSAPTITSTGSASITFGAGDHLVEATYPGDSNYSSSASSTTTLAGPAVTTLGLGVSGGSHVYGQSLVLTATLSPYSGSGYSTNGEPVSFYNNGMFLGSGTLSSGVATLWLNSLGAGSYSFSANYAGDGSFLAISSASIPATISPATPSINWTTPSAITYGAALSSTQLNASSSVSGTFSYSPAVGTVLTAGSQSLSVTFAPTDTTDYTSASAHVTLTVNQAMPTITWTNPIPITYGYALGNTQLNATASVPGTFAYNPASGTVLAVGDYTLSTTFTPSDSTDYAAAASTVDLWVVNPYPLISNTDPSYVTAGASGFTLTVSGSGFMPSSTIYWGNTALTTTYVSPMQLTAPITSTQIAAAGTVGITVQTGTPGGGTSNSFQFEIDTSNSGSAPVTITTTTAVVAAGSAANYTFSLPSNMTGVSVGCLNLPAGTSCTYVAGSSMVTIGTSTTTSPGKYAITVVFTGMIPTSTTSAWILAPFLLLPVWLLRRRIRKASGQWAALCLVLVLTGVAVMIGCGGGNSGSTGGGSMTQVTTSSGVSLTVK